ncbi:hypothetical protein QTG92_09635 [Clostridium perfringens]|nr:hypothetical protein [Clostridium perfringens]
MELKKIMSQWKKISYNQIKTLLELLDYFNGGIIPISVVKRKLNLTNDEVEDLMIFLETKGILKSAFKVFCSDKFESTREEIYDDIRKIPKKHCDKCEKECMYLENVVVVFKVVQN